MKGDHYKWRAMH
ncbi:hypothetical protein MJ575_25910 [Klebsiella pneumoniae]|nr:hypothetical protein MJ575_25910 [Klebsiella pneumoniae]